MVSIRGMINKGGGNKAVVDEKRISTRILEYIVSTLVHGTVS